MKNLLRFVIVNSLLFVSVSAFSQTPGRIPSEKPKLVVCMVVDQLRYDYIHRYWDKSGDEGIRRLVTSGTFCKNAAYDYLINQTAVGHATIATGALPSHHGIISNNWYKPCKCFIKSN